MLICGIEFKSSETASCAKGVIIKEKTNITVFCYLHYNIDFLEKRRKYFEHIFWSFCNLCGIELKSSDNARCSRRGGGGVTFKERMKMPSSAFFLKS